MNDLRSWPIGSGLPAVFTLAADVRLAAQPAPDDQIWELAAAGHSSAADSTALALSTQYGGRVQGASLVPMWVIDGRAIHAVSDYAAAPHVTQFAPGLIRVNAAITPTLHLEATYFAFDGQTIGGQFTLINTAAVSVTLRLDLVGFAALRGRAAKSAVIAVTSKDGDGYGLRPCLLPTFAPVVVLRGDAGLAQMVDESSTKIGLPVTLAAAEKTSVRWVHVGMASSRAAEAHALKLLYADWKPHYRRIVELAHAAPDIHTEDAAHDAAIALSQHALLSGYVPPPPGLPHPIITEHRPAGHTLPRSAALPYVAALGTAAAAPALAHGVLKNYLATQQPDGWIDLVPGGTSVPGQLRVPCPPLLARLAWGIFQYTEDDAFLRDAYPRLLKFLRRWFARDLDADGDGLPEWPSAAPFGLPPLPTFTPALNDTPADPAQTEAPDLIAYLLSEAISLQEIGYYLREPAEPWLKTTTAGLEAALESLWDAERGLYRRRDRDAHTTPPGDRLLSDAPGGEEHFIAQQLTPPARVSVTISGGWEHRPAVLLTISGVNAAGEAVRETLDASRFRWQTGRGTVTSDLVYQRVDTLHTAGLTRVYRLNAAAIDLTRADITGLLPLYAVRLPPGRAAALQATLFNGDWLHPNGVTAIPASDPAFAAPASPGSPAVVGSGWLTLLGEGLIEAGYLAEAADLTRRYLDAVTRALAHDPPVLPEAYPPSGDPLSTGRGHLLGAAPVHLLLRVFGIRIIDAHRVWAGGPFVWPHPVTIRQHGVSVTRSAAGTQIRFPGGHSHRLEADAPFQEVMDRRSPSSAESE